MDIKELLILAIESLKSNIIRTLLTMLGIIIGIASVIAIISIGEGSTKSIVGEISSFGANVITVSPGRLQRGPGGGGGSVTTLVADDRDRIKKLPNVSAVSAVVNKSYTITANSEETNTNVRGVEDTYSSINSLVFTQGAFFEKAEVDGMSRVVILGDQLVEDLFGENAEVIGTAVRIDSKSFRIVGVVQDSNEVLMPITTAQKILMGQTYFNSISVQVTSSNVVSTTSTAIEDLLLLQHDITDPTLADFNVRNSQALAEGVTNVTGTLTSLLSGIATISLLVGGIGIMNIMLVTVTERTREIGLSKAIGAKRKDILTQFLIEATVLTFIGGVLGLILGFIIAYVASRVMSIDFVININSVLLAFGVSGGVGIIFGYYPAQKASKLHPIDALRYE